MLLIFNITAVLILVLILCYSVPFVTWINIPAAHNALIPGLVLMSMLFHTILVSMSTKTGFKLKFFSHVA